MASGGKEEYQEFFRKKMEEHGLSEIDGVSEDKLKKFFEDVDQGWKADKESSVSDRLASLSSKVARATHVAQGFSEEINMVQIYYYNPETGDEGYKNQRVRNWTEAGKLADRFQNRGIQVGSISNES